MLSIKPALPEDAASITKIKTDAFNQEINTYLGRNGGPPGYDQVESELEIIHNCIAKKILLNGQLIGAFFLIPINETTMIFEDFVITPSEQGKGYGRQTFTLLETMYDWVHEWRLSTPIFSIGNQHLYQSVGYEEQSRDENEVYYCKKI